MLRFLLPLAAAGAGLSAAPAGAAAADRFGVDVTVIKGRAVETRCDDGSVAVVAVTHTWRISGSGELPAGGGVLTVTHEREDAKVREAPGREPELERDVVPLGERDRGFAPAVRRSGEQIVLDAGRLTPVRRLARGPVPAAGQTEKLRMSRRSQATRLPAPDGCTRKRTRATLARGSLIRLG